MKSRRPFFHVISKPKGRRNLYETIVTNYDGNRMQLTIGLGVFSPASVEAG
ncbi:hypothetical protein ACPUEN_06540 [Algoriphagus yeomjeoni]|uniref:hypothetical protein n=1 Tax=Algoriphagus yeomjeoni TaxID=291403 RepID=UPI003CE521A6